MFWFFENIYLISIRLGIPLIRIICYSSTVSGGIEHLLLPWNAGFKCSADSWLFRVGGCDTGAGRSLEIPRFNPADHHSTMAP